jgi:hypothetical protein
MSVNMALLTIERSSSSEELAMASGQFSSIPKQLRPNKTEIQCQFEPQLAVECPADEG